MHDRGEFVNQVFGWVVGSLLVVLGCSTTSPAQRPQSPEKKYENAKLGCWFRHGQDEAREAGPGATLQTTTATGTTDSAIDVAFRACLQKAQADYEQDLAAAKGPHPVEPNDGG